jgi:WhiB family redox-sensing transcriptional regulator
MDFAMTLLLSPLPTATATGTAESSTALTSVPEIDAAGEFDDVDAGTSYARCADGNGTLSHLFFSDDDHQLARAKAICRPCGLKTSCLTGAIERHEPYGVWGGTLVLDGVAVEVKRKRGRPPKQPQPVLVLDEVPIPAHLVA